MSMNDDSELASGVTSSELFSNEKPSKTTETLLKEQNDELEKLLPTAQQQVDALNREIAQANMLTDFVDMLGNLPTDIPDDTLRAKLEARFAYINYLLSRKNMIVSSLDTEGIELEDVGVVPTPLFETVNFRQTVPDTQPRGWRAIRQGIRDLLRGSPMQ